MRLMRLLIVGMFIGVFYTAYRPFPQLYPNSRMADFAPKNSPTPSPYPQNNKHIEVENVSSISRFHRLMLPNPVRATLWLPFSEKLITATAIYYGTVGDVREYDLSHLATTPIFISQLGASLLDVSPDGHLMALGGGKKNTILDTNTYHTQSRLLLNTPLAVEFSALSFSPDATLIATADTQLDIKIWDVATGQEVQRLSTAETLEMLGGGAVIYAVNFWGQDSLLFTDSIGEERPLVYRWDFNDAAVPTPFPLVPHSPHLGTNTSTSLALHSSHQLIAAGGWDGHILIWDAATLHLQHILLGHTSWITDIAFNPQGTLLVSSAMDGTVRFWDVVSGEQRHYLTFENAAITSIAFNQDGSILALGGSDGELSLWAIP